MLAVGALLALSVPVSARAQREVPMHGIDHHNRLLLVRAQATGKTDGIVLLATRLGATDSVVRAAVALGATVETRFDDVGYARVRLPLAQFARVRALPGVIEARIDEGYLSYGYDQGTDPAAIKSLEKTIPKQDTASRHKLPALPAAALTANNPYVPLADMGALQLRAAHPTFDGRGVTIGVLEGGTLDFTHPALQGAKQLTGDSVAKIRGILDPAAYESGDVANRATLLTVDTFPHHEHVRRTGTIDASDGTFMLEGHLYHAPHPGRFSVGMYHGGPFGAPPIDYGVAWDEAQGLVWVDTNRDFDLRDEKPLTDINRAFSAGWLRRDSTAAHPQSAVSFAVAFDSGGAGLRVYEGTAGHQTMVGSTAAGQHLLGGQATGVAPAAQLVIVNSGESLGIEIEGFVRAERDPRIDLITCSQTGETFPAAGESILSLILSRAIAVYHKPIFAAADNAGPVMTVTGEPAATPALVSVGASADRATLKAHFGWDVPDSLELISYSSRGPSRLGALKPDLVAPNLFLTGAPCSAKPDDRGPTQYAVPKCYMLGGGTSNAAPAAAGAAALLISAAKQQHLPTDAAHIAWAMRMGARPLSGYAVHEQGNGLVDLVHALALLQHAPRELPVIETQAPVRLTISPYLRTPGEGVGLYEREGWAAGDTGTRVVTLTRRTGPDGPIRYAVRWVGNDGTFGSPTTVTLRRDAATAVPVHIAPRGAGVHSAALRLLDPATGAPIHAVLATVVAAEQFTQATGFTVHTARHVSWPRATSVFVNVPPGAGMMRVTLRVGRGRYKLRTEDSRFGDDIEWQTYFKGYRYPFSGYTFVTTGQTGVQLFPHPRPGVWELLVEPFDQPVFGGDSAQYHIPGDIELTATVEGAEPAAPPFESSGGQADHVTWTNRLAPLEHGVVHAEMGARRQGHATVDSTKGPTTIELRVDPGTTALRVQATPADSAADVDLYLYDCSGDQCFLWDDDLGVQATKTLLVRAPAAGAWKLVLDPARVPTGTTQVTYTTTITNPAYGTADVANDSASRRSGESWTSRLTMHPLGTVPDSTDRVVVAEAIDAGAEAAEAAHTIARFGGTPYRPAEAGVAIIKVER